MNERSNFVGALLALAAFGIFSTHDVVLKYLGASFGPFQIVFFTVLFAFPMTTLMLIRDSSDGNLRPRHPWWVALRSLASVLAGVAAFHAFSVLPLAQAYAIIFAMPLLITILAIPILGESVRIHRWAAVVVGLIGVVVVMRPGQTTLGLGHLAALTCAISGALASVIVRKIGREERSIVLMLYPLMANFFLMILILPFVYVPVQLVDLGGFGLMAVLAFAANLLLIAAYKNGEAAVIAPMQYSQIIWALIFGLLLFDEVPDLTTFVGVGIIVASGMYIVLREGRSDTSENQPVLRTRSRPGMPSVVRVGSQLKPEERDRTLGED